MIETVQQVNLIKTPPQSPAPRKNFVPIIIGIVGFLVLIVLGYVFIAKPYVIQKSIEQINAVSPTQSEEVTPTPELIDTAPGIPQNQKAKVLVHHSDSTFSVYLVPIHSVSLYSQTLPHGDTVVTVTNP